MRVAVLTDIHGNRHALEAVLRACADAGVDELWCLGDVVGYGADPDACVALVRERCALTLCGNHDLAVRGDLSIAEFSSGAAAAARWTREAIDPASLAFLAALEPQALDRPVGLFHASPRDPIWEYVVSLGAAAACLDVQSHRVCLVGHSHVALAFHRPDGGAVEGELRADGSAAALDHGTWLLNPGSVGQPRDGDPRAAWLELDLEAPRATWRRTPYDIEAAGRAIRRVGLPSALADRLHLGQ